jgi:hypothetical protein
MNPWAVTTVLATLVAWSAGALVLRTGGGRRVSRRLAALLFVEGTAVITTEAGLLLLVNDVRTGMQISLMHAVADLLVLTLYPLFLAAALDVPAVRVFRARAAEIGLLVLGASGVLAVVLFPSAFVVAGYRQAAGEPLRWLFEWGSTWKVVAAGLVGMYTLGVVASVSALRRAESDAARRRARVFLLAFGTRDVVWGGIYLIAMLAGDTITPTQLAWIAQAYAGSLLVYALLVGYGVLTVQLFDIDLRVRWTIKNGTVAAAFVAVFFLVSESATTFLSDRLGNVLGLIASSLLIFLFTPLQRTAERIADRAMPGVRDTPEYTSYKKLQVYAAALESAYQDSAISDRERAMLARIADSLELHPGDAEQLERDVRARVARAVVGS